MADEVAATSGVPDVREPGQVPEGAAGVSVVAGPAHAVASASGAAGAVDQAEGAIGFPPLRGDWDDILLWQRLAYGHRARRYAGSTH